MAEGAPAPLATLTSGAGPGLVNSFTKQSLGCAIDAKLQSYLIRIGELSVKL